jgi:hypothetical protein
MFLLVVPTFLSPCFVSMRFCLLAASSIFCVSSVLYRSHKHLFLFLRFGCWLIPSCASMNALCKSFLFLPLVSLSCVLCCCGTFVPAMAFLFFVSLITSVCIACSASSLLQSSLFSSVSLFHCLIMFRVSLVYCCCSFVPAVSVSVLSACFPLWV